ncbi:MAG: hypothetical protein HRT36_01815 [Alphaproteobacteria bacterium]|nr:hypothetical protein [Alphaproteobacteria bacterium]
MHLIRLILLLPIIVVLGSFLVSNTQEIAWSLWPLPFTFGTPAYAIPLLALALGLLLGSLIMWLKISLRLARLSTNANPLETSRSVVPSS